MESGERPHPAPISGDTKVTGRREMELAGERIDLIRENAHAEARDAGSGTALVR